MQLFQFLISGNRAVFIAYLEILWLLFYIILHFNIASADLCVTIKEIYTQKDKQAKFPGFFILPKFEKWARS